MNQKPTTDLAGFLKQAQATEAEHKKLIQKMISEGMRVAPLPRAPASYPSGFLRTLSKIMPQMGTSRQDPNLVIQQESMSGGMLNQRIPEEGDLSPTVVNGYIRVKVYGEEGGSFSSCTVIGTDGNNMECLVAWNTPQPMSVSGVTGVNLTFPFLSELSISAFYVYLTGIGRALVDLEINGAAGDS